MCRPVAENENETDVGNTGGLSSIGNVTTLLLLGTEIFGNPSQ